MPGSILPRDIVTICKNDYSMTAYIHLLFTTIVSNISNEHAFRSAHEDDPTGKSRASSCNRTISRGAYDLARSA